MIIKILIGKIIINLKKDGTEMRSLEAIIRANERADQAAKEREQEAKKESSEKK